MSSLKTKMLSLVLVMAMVITMMPINAFATDIEGESISTETEATGVTEKEENSSVPEQPTINTVTSTTIVLNSVDDCEYSLDGETWQESYTFTDLQPNTTYVLYQRYAETETAYASQNSEPLEVTTKGKSSNVMSPELISVEGNVVTLAEVFGYEYKYIGGEWQDDNIFVLDSFTSYEFVQREKETDTMEASDDSPSIFISTERITELPLGAVGIYTKADLEAIKDDTSSSAYYILMNDIKFIDADFEEYGEFYNEGFGWESISVFRGKIDGNGYSVKNIKSTSDDKINFIYINYGEIVNLALENVDFVVSSDDSTKYIDAGGIVGTNRGVISGCSISGNLTIEKKDGNYASGAYAGGICTSNYGKVNQCSNAATISAEAYDSAYAGGIVGRNDTNGVVNNSYNTGEVLTFINDQYNAYTYTGGIAGKNYGQISSCYNIGVLDSKRNSNLLGAYTGAIVGDNDGTIDNCYYSELQKKSSGEGDGTETETEKLTLKELSQPNSYVGFDFEQIWNMGTGDNATPCLKDKASFALQENTTEFAGGTGTVFSPYEITSKQELANVNNHLGAAYVLMNDISFELEDFEEDGLFYNEGKGWISIGSDYYKDFEGIFDGQNHTIKGLVVNDQKYMGLFGVSKGIIANINVEDIYIASDSTNVVYVGGIAGNYQGDSLLNCTSDVNIEIGNVYNARVGGLVGSSSGNINQCSSVGAINVEAIGSSGNEKFIGGLIGSCGKTVTDSYSLVSVYLKHRGGSNDYARVGGIVGNSETGLTITNCYFAGNAYIECTYTYLSKDCSTKLYGKSNDIAVNNSYVLCDEGTVLINGVDVAKTTIQFSSGEVTYLLNNGYSTTSAIWKQNLGENGDIYPVLDNEHGIVYKCDKYNCQGQKYDYTYCNVYDSIYENHDIVSYRAQEPTCSSVGWESYEKCQNCDYTTYVEIDKLDHTWEYDYTTDKESSCTEKGSKSIHCSECDAKKDEVTLDALGHSYETVISKATTSNNGTSKQVCATCGDVKSTEVIYKISSVTLSTSAYTYDGKTKSPSVVVKDSKGNKLTKGEDYTVTYGSSSRSAIGRYSVKVTFRGEYSGSKTLYFTIGPKNPSSVSAKLYGYDDVKVSWSKVSGATGYVVYYKKSTATSWSSKSTTGTSVKLADLADGVKYNIKVVTYKTKSGYKCYNAGKATSIYTLKKVTGVTTVKSGTKVKVSWTNISGETGYQISQSTKKSGTNIVATYKTTSGKSKTISATKGKSYYYKVRAYKVVDGKKIYGPWSTAVKFVRK